MSTPAANAAKQDPSPNSSLTPAGRQSVQAQAKCSHPATLPADTKSPEDSDPRRPSSTIGDSGVFVPAACPGPAGTWQCALPFGHPGDHERFSPESRLTSPQLALLEGVRELRRERDELLGTCADLLAACRAALASIEMADVLDGKPDHIRPIKVLLRAAIKKAEAR